MVLGLEFEAKGRTPSSTNPKHCTLPPLSGQNRRAVAVPNQTQHGPKVKQHLRESLFPFISRFEEFTSVKISNNALNFLLAQYRAIFKRAYIKGIASAQAQAADNDQWYYFDNTSSTWKQHEYNVGAGQVNQAAGAVEDSRYTVESGGQADGSITSGSLTIGAHDPAGTGNNDVQTVTTNAAGGYIYSSGNASISNFNITDSHVTLLSGGSIGQDAHGAYIEIDNGNANATDNYVTVNAGTINNSTYGAQIKTSGGTATATGNGVSIDVTGTNTLKVSAANTDADGIFGARIKTEDGIANASGNYVEIKAAETVTGLILGHGGVLRLYRSPATVLKLP